MVYKINIIGPVPDRIGKKIRPHYYQALMP